MLNIFSLYLEMHLVKKIILWRDIFDRHYIKMQSAIFKRIIMIRIRIIKTFLQPTYLQNFLFDTVLPGLPSLL